MEDREPVTADDTAPDARPGRLGAAVVVLFAVVVVALWATTGIGRVLRAPPAPLAVVVTLLPWLYALFAAILFSVWCVLPDRRGLPVLLTAVVLSAAVLWGPVWPARPQVAAGEEVRVMTWNVRRLWGGEQDGGDPTACVAEGVRAEAPDLLALLEVSRADVDALSALLDLDCAHTDYLATGSDRTGGVAVCTLGDWTLREASAQRFTDDDDWRYLFSEVERGGRVLNLLAVHLHPYYPALSRDDVRTSVRDLARGAPGAIVDVGRTGEEVIRTQGAQSVALLDRVDKFVDPTLVVGDFNSTRDAALHTALRRSLIDAWERGGQGFGATIRLAGRIPLRIDYVYATDAFAVGAARVPALDCSDHRPVVADLVLRDAP